MVLECSDENILSLGISLLRFRGTGVALVRRTLPLCARRTGLLDRFFEDLHRPLRFANGDFHARDLLDCAKIVHVIDVAKADGGSAKTRPAGAPDAMDVCFRHVRQIVVDT